MKEGEPHPESLENALNKIVKELRQRAEKFPYEDFSKEPHERHSAVIELSNLPYPVKITFTLDKESKVDPLKPDQWHLAIVFKNGERVPFNIEQPIVKAFFPEDGAIGKYDHEDPSSHWWKPILS